MDITKKITPLAGAFILGCIPFNANSALISDLLITEIMANPDAVSDTNGEWFELYNPTLETVDLEGAVLSDDGTNSHTISTGSSLIISPGEYFVLGRNGDSTSNGGFTADYVYSGFTLGNSGDQIVFSEGGIEMLRFSYSSGFVGLGRSTELLGDIMIEANYGLTDSSSTYGLGDIGTPGEAGAYTPSPVPLPAAVWLFASGLAGLIGISRRNKSKS